ncbi:MAG TPA: hypothetical protein VE912_03210 [Bacteroidales bacterium]|nr:hypothetical protein [Bacteroidales bacterium]
MIQSEQGKRIIVWVVALCSLGLFSIIFIPASLRDAIQLLGILIIIFFNAIYMIYDNTPRMRQYFRNEIILFLLSTFFSMFIAYAYHHQGFGTTFIVQRFMYYYFFYFLLHNLRIKAIDLERIVVIIGIIYAVLYVLQFAAYPFQLIDSRINPSRGTIRIFFPGNSYMFIAYFILLQQYFTFNRLRYLLIILLFFAVGGILQGTRQSLATMVLLTGANILFSNRVKSKFGIIFISLIGVGALFLMFQDIFLQMFNVTRQQSQDASTNIRVMAAIFFLTDFMPAKIAYIFGNGQDSLNAAFGAQVNYYKTFYGFYQSDIGIIGNYSKFGILFVVAQLSIMIRVIFGKLHRNLAYLKYFMVSVALTMFVGGGYFGAAIDIPAIVIVVYLIDYYKNYPDPRIQMEEKNQVTKYI